MRDSSTGRDPELPRACDGCGVLLPDGSAWFVVDVQVYAPPTELVLDEQELARDHAAELGALARRLESLDPDEAQDDVHRAFRFELCRPCQRAYLVSPL